MEERVVDYFVVAGLPEDKPEPIDEDLCDGLNPNQQNIEPITDITVIFPTLGEYVPKGFDCVEQTPTGYPANLNSGSIRSPEVYLCYRRGRDKPPLVDIGVMYDGKERLLPDAEVVLSTPEGKPANVNNTSARTLLTFRRAPENMPCNELVVTDICVIFQNKGEKPPHAFCMIQKNLNKGMMGCDVFLCYKKSMNRPPLLSFKPEVLLRYPPVDRKTFPCPPLAATFCLPMCATIECWPKQAAQPRPVFSTFVLTVADATERIYGAAITFYEEYSSHEKLTDEQKEVLGYILASDKEEKNLHVNKCICILSHHAFFDAFRTFLYYLYWMTRSGPHDVPIERYISHLLEEVPFPSAQRPHILMQLSGTQNLLLSHPQDSPLPKSGASFRSMLNNLGPENCLMVLLLVLTEQKLLIHSLRPDVLTAVAEAISVLIFPFHWQCPFIPLCPLGLCGVLQAPVPFLVGVDSRFFDLYEPPTDVTCIDLDTNTVTISEDKKYVINLKLLPKKPTRILKHALESIKQVSDKMAMMSRASAKGRNDASEAMDIDFQAKRRERMIEIEIQESFLRFMTSVLKGYRSFLLPITKAPTIGATDASSLFDFQGFMRSRDKTYQKFYQLMLRTQMFIRFIEERSFVSENDSSLEYFDECVDKVEADDSDGVKLLEINEGNQSERTVFVMPPEPTGLPLNAAYTYSAKFVLREGLFMGPRLKSQSLDRVMQQNEQSTPGSPVARRTKQEIKSAQKVAKKYSEKPHLWAKYLLSTCYSIWFIHLPSYASIASSKHMALLMAYEMLVRMANCGLQPADEVCYRVVMQLCGLYSQPVIAVKVLLKMKRCGMTPNAITYGYYNKAVLEAEWPSNVSNSSQLMWNKLRNVIIGVAQFRAATRHRGSAGAGDEIDDRISTGSGTSGDSQMLHQNKNNAPPSARLHSSATLSPQSISNDSSSNNANGKSQSDSEATNVSTAIPTRISSSSDIGYGSMHEQKISSEPDIVDVDVEYPASSDKQAKPAKFWGKMGQSFDQWVKTGMSSLASIAADTSYYSQSGLIMGGGGYTESYHSKSLGQYDDDDDDEFDEQPPKSNDIKGKSRRRLEFGNDEDPVLDDKSQSQTLRLLRSVSFGNDTQIMSKLKVLKQDIISETKRRQEGDEQKSISKSPSSQDDPRRSASVESSSSLEAKINQYYEPQGGSSRDTSAEKSYSNSREVTPVEDESHESYQDTLRPCTLDPPRSPSIQIRAKELSREVTPSSPARTPVTQNDPLGALSEPCSPDAVKSSNFMQPPNRDSPKRTCSEGHIGGISEKTIMGPPETPKGFHRSSTLPSYGCIGDRNGSNASMNSVPSDDKLASCVGSAGGAGGVSSLTVFNAGLKNPFGRYSPGRLSLRKAGTSFIESTIGGKKAEALMEGFNQFKSVAAVTMKTKLEELKEAVGNNNTPGKTGPFGRYDDPRGDETEDWDGEPASDQWASVSESYLDQLLTAETTSTRASFASADYGGSHQTDTPLSASRQSLLMVDHIKNIAGASGRNNLPRPISLEISMTTCSICHNCSSLCFDEEIMAGWTAEDSNLNSRCPHCKKWEVPFLQVSVVDYRYNPMPQPLQNLPLTSAPSLESINSNFNNISRRTSIINPSASYPVNSTVNQAMEKLSISKDIANKVPETLVEKTASDKNIVVNNSENVDDQDVELGNLLDLPTVDPLGVLEEIREKSRRSSPDVESNLAKSEQTESIQQQQQKDFLAAGVTSQSENLSASASASCNPEFLGVQAEGLVSEPIVVPYLSPLVLRKELENVLDHEGDSCLVQPTFVDEHPIIYWNLVWFFHRASLPSHIKGLSLQAKSVVPRKPSTSETDAAEELKIHPSWDGADYRSVSVKCLWDNPKYHEQFTSPLYLDWLRIKDQDKSEKVDEEGKENVDDTNLLKLMNNILRAANGNTLGQTCPQLLYHYHKQSKGRHYPTYRDILFLSLIAGRDSVEAYGYGLDKEYRDVYSKLRCNDDYESMDVGDTPPSDTALFCRRYFKELQLLSSKGN